jgi:outer membrane protein OmpA-like peptidoglycan-associated protein
MPAFDGGSNLPNFIKEAGPNFFDILKVRLLFYALFAFFLLIHPCLYGQRETRKLKKAGVVQLNDTVTHYGQSGMFRFPNVNKVFMYTNQKEMQDIERLKASGQDSLLYVKLKAYVSSFGIGNFARNTPMLWNLAKLSEKYGAPGEALLLYKLSLKHHRQGIDISHITRRYDSIELDQKKYYVPLDYYYELVNYRREVDTLRPPHAVLVSMGDQVNSPKEDYGPNIGNIDNMMLFTSKRNYRADMLGNYTYDEDLFYSLRTDSAWDDVHEFKDINTSYNEGSVCISSDGTLMIFSRCNAKDSKGGCDLYSATLKDSVWTDIKNMGPAINGTSWDSHPSLTHNADTLFFATDRLGGFGESDIYFAVRDSKGEWQKAANAGPIVNTIKSEVSPFFHHLHNVLYFSSNGHPLNFGDFDIYKSYWKDAIWNEPKNVGPLVNGEGDETYFTIDSKSYQLYYARSSGDDKKNLDLYSFRVPMEAQPEAVVALKGSLKDRNGDAMKGIVSIIDLDAGVEVAPKFLREDGTFDFSLINKRNYLLIIQGDEYFRIEEIFFLDGAKEINKVAEPIESKIAFSSVEFENGKANILEIMHSDLNKLGNFLVDHPGLAVTISGHTDSAGKEESNLKLSQARADAIKTYLIETFMIDLNRIVAIGYGSARPAAQELTDDHRQLNRRVEFEISRIK